MYVSEKRTLQIPEVQHLGEVHLRGGGGPAAGARGGRARGRVGRRGRGGRAARVELVGPPRARARTQSAEHVHRALDDSLRQRVARARRVARRAVHLLVVEQVERAEQLTLADRALLGVLRSRRLHALLDAAHFLQLLRDALELAARLVPRARRPPTADAGYIITHMHTLYEYLNSDEKRNESEQSAYSRVR